MGSMDPESPYVRAYCTVADHRSIRVRRNRSTAGIAVAGNVAEAVLQTEVTLRCNTTDPQIVEIRSADKKQVRRAQGESNFESLLDVEKLQSFLRIHPKTLRNKARRGIIPGVHVGRLWRFRPSALNEWLDGIAS